MAQSRISILLARWRALLARGERTPSGTSARDEADEATRRAHRDYEDESLRLHEAHERPESRLSAARRTLNRSGNIRRASRMKRERAEAAGDEAEFRRELGEDANDAPR